jgi:DNA replication protein DnaC
MLDHSTLELRARPAGHGAAFANSLKTPRRAISSTPNCSPSCSIPRHLTWIRQHRNLLVIGPTGIGKSGISCALDHKACRENLSVLNQRVPRLTAALALARGDRRDAKLLRSLAWVNLLNLEDWEPEPLGPEQHRDLLEIVKDRYDTGSLLITSQRWYAIIGEPTLADAILDLVVQNAYRIELNCDSLRKRRGAETAR